MAVEYTDPALVSAVRQTDLPPSPSVTGYGRKIPTSYMLCYAGSWKRVYVMVYGNSGSAYIRHRHAELFLDTDTEHRLHEETKGVGTPTPQKVGA